MMVHTATAELTWFSCPRCSHSVAAIRGLVDGIQHGIHGLLVDQTVESLASGSRH